MNSAGKLIISWIKIPDDVEKCSLITPNAGATAAPAITVRSEMDKMVVLIFFDFGASIKIVFNLIQKEISDTYNFYEILRCLQIRPQR